jgi:hypothetical protein
MSNSNILIPISDEQANAIQEALKTLQGFGGFLKKHSGSVAAQARDRIRSATTGAN